LLIGPGINAHTICGTDQTFGLPEGIHASAFGFVGGMSRSTFYCTLPAGLLPVRSCARCVVIEEIRDSNA
jgi:hypothetical protein